MAASNPTSTPLIGIFLITTSPSQGTTLTFRYPPYPLSSARLMRPLPYRQGSRHGLDGIYQASHLPESWEEREEMEEEVREMEERGDWADEEEDYLWRGPDWGRELGTPTSATSAGGAGSVRGRSVSRSPTSTTSGGGGAAQGGSKSTSPSSQNRRADSRTSPSDSGEDAEQQLHDMLHSDYDTVLSFPGSTLAEILAPKAELCYQKFELVVDDLAFVGHPVTTAKDGVWRMDNLAAPPSGSGRAGADSPEGERGRSLPPSTPAQTREGGQVESSPDSSLLTSSVNGKQEGQHHAERVTFFHLVLVIDRPDPASYHTSDLSAFLAPYHAQVAFKLTAGLLHEEARAAYVSANCAQLVELQERALGRGEWYEQFCEEVSGEGGVDLARVIREVWETISVDGSCTVGVNHIAIDVQLPPRRVVQDWGEEEEEEGEEREYELEEGEEGLGRGVEADRMVYGWVPRLRGWKGLLMLDDDLGEEEGEEEELDGMTDDERDAHELRRRFFATVRDGPTLSLSDVSNLLDLDLYDEVFPLARQLIYTRKAKLIDVVRENMKSYYYPTSSPDVSPADHFHAFSRRFPQLPHLATILSAISTTPVLFSSLVPSSKDRPIYRDALIWMLKRDLVEMLHQRVRLVATQELKESVYRARLDRANRRKLSLSMNMTEPTESSSVSPETPFLPTHTNGLLSPMLLQPTRLPVIHQSSASEGYESWSSDVQDEGKSEEEADVAESVILDPGRASKLERRWIDEMERGKDSKLVDLFERLLPYFDGKTTTVEILYRAEVGRRELRNVLSGFDPYVLTSLHS